MTLTDLANHICTQTGMTDTDDVAAAQMFLQRRLEMIWAAALWRDSLLEATLTINPDGTTTLADSYWIPERSVLLLPAAIEKVIAARINTNTLEVASLESYYRTDTDWLNYQGTPFEFQILKPVVMEWASAQSVSALDTNAADTGATPSIACQYSYSPDGVTITNGTVGVNGQITDSGGTRSATMLQLFTFSKPPTQGNVALRFSVPVNAAGITYSGPAQPVATMPVTQGQVYTITPGANENGVLLVNGTQTLTLQTGTAVTVTAQGAQLLFEYPNLISASAAYDQNGQFEVGANPNASYVLVWGANEANVNPPDGLFTVNPGAGQTSSFSPTSNQQPYALFASVNSQPGIPVTAQWYAAGGAPLTATIINVVTFATITANCNNAPTHQRIRLTEAPQVSINLRVLGKGRCPIMGPYDTVPITNSEPALMAFARGDLLLRQRQAGKASLAQQEGATLLKALIEAEAFHQGGEFRIQPDGGFGQDNFWMQTTPDSWHPV